MQQGDIPTEGTAYVALKGEERLHHLDKIKRRPRHTDKLVQYSLAGL